MNKILSDILNVAMRIRTGPISDNSVIISNPIANNLGYTGPMKIEPEEWKTITERK